MRGAWRAAVGGGEAGTLVLGVTGTAAIMPRSAVLSPEVAAVGGRDAVLSYRFRESSDADFAPHSRATLRARTGPRHRRADQPCARRCAGGRRRGAGIQAA